MQELLAGVAALAPPDALERLQSGRSTLIAELPAIHAALRSASAVQQEELATCAVADNPEQGRLLVRAIASIDTADVAALALSASQTSTTATVSPLCALHDAEVMGAVHRIFVSLPADAKASVLQACLSSAASAHKPCTPCADKRGRVAGPITACVCVDRQVLLLEREQ